MSQEAETKRKWKCKYCTYENFPSSIRCTMCREEKVLAGLNSDIYQLAYAGPSLCSNENENLVSGKCEFLFSYETYATFRLFFIDNF